MAGVPVRGVPALQPPPDAHCGPTTTTAVVALARFNARLVPSYEVNGAVVPLPPLHCTMRSAGSEVAGVTAVALKSGAGEPSTRSNVPEGVALSSRVPVPIA